MIVNSSFLVIASAFTLFSLAALADVPDVPERPLGIYSGNLESEMGLTRMENWERWTEIVEQADGCFSQLESVFEFMLSSRISEERMRQICRIEGINTELLVLVHPPGHTLDSIDGVFSERSSGWVNRYSSGDTNVSLTYTLTPIRPNFWSITMENHVGAPEFEGEELYFWARDYTSLAWIGARSPDVDSIENVQLISCTRPGCRATYMMPSCDNSVEFKLMARTVDNESEELFLINYDHIHALSEIIRQGFIEHSCE